MTYRARNIGIAVALAVAAALLTSFYVTNYKRHVQRGEDHVTVLVAKRDIPVGTAGSDAVGMLSTTQVPRRSVVPGSISSPDEIKSLVASQETFAGEQITTQRFTSVAQTGVEGQLRGNLRAFQVAGDQNQLLAGTLKDNDHVDLVAAITSSGSNQHVFSRGGTEKRKDHWIAEIATVPIRHAVDFDRAEQGRQTGRRHDSIRRDLGA